jgi:hypothetical protein
VCSTSNGGGITSAGSATLTNVTVSGNSLDGIHGVGGGGPMQMKNTLVANNGGDDCVGSIFSSDHSLCGDDPRLGPLQNNGGPTFTQALLPGSPAIDAGDDAVTSPPLNLRTDQRGLPRQAGENVDIGAYEVQQAGAAACVGNCKGDQQVNVADLVTMVNIALGNSPVTACEAGDSNLDRRITIDEILIAVTNAFNGCPTT